MSQVQLDVNWTYPGDYFAINTNINHCVVLPRLADAQYASGEGREIAPEGMKRVSQSGNRAQLWMCLVVKVKSDAVLYGEQYCIGTWNVRSTNQGKLEVVRLPMARVNIDILRISELKCMGSGKFNSDDLISTNLGKNPLEEMEST